MSQPDTARTPASRARLGRRSLDLFIFSPLKSAGLAAVCVVLGLVFVSGWVEPSPHRHYIAGQNEVLALLCWALAAVFAGAAILGVRRQCGGGKDAR